jgi:alpha-tubulin suppressor-like RCC1 family protein
MLQPRFWLTKVPFRCGMRALFVVLAGPLAACSPAERIIPVPQLPDELVAIAITAGNEHTCALDEDRAAWCWGANTSGQLGDGGVEDRPAPSPVLIAAAFVTLSAGSHHTCGLDDNSVVLCWGDNSFGQLGREGTGRSTPEVVAGLPPMAGISSGTQHTCSWTEAGEAFCWGENQFGQLGNGTTVGSSEPVAVRGGLAFNAVHAGLFSTCGVTDELVTHCWGDNAWGLVRGETATNVLVPTEVQTGYEVRSFALGQTHACIVTTRSEVQCWGENAFGQLGDGTTAGTEELIQPLSETVFSVASGPRSDHSCALTANGRAFCWGMNEGHQAGVASAAFVIAPPFRVPTNVLVTDVVVGRVHSCALAATSLVYCWGTNGRGQLGRGPEAGPGAFDAPARVQWPES